MHLIKIFSSSTSTFLTISFLALIIQGCQKTVPDYSSLPQAEPVKYNLVLHKPSEVVSKDTQRMLDIFGGFLSAMSNNSPAVLDNFLQPDFKLHVVYENGTSESYGISEVSEFSDQKDLKLIFFKDAMYYPLQINVVTTGEVLLILKVAKSSKYFQSKQTVFVTFNDDLSSISSMAIRPTLPKTYDSEPEIYLSRISNSNNEYARNWKYLITLLNPDGAVDLVKEYEVTGVTRDESPHSVLVVFPEPLPLRAIIRIEHQFFVTRKQKWLNPYRFFYIIDEPGEFQVIESISRAGGPAKRTITYRVFVNGKKVAERTVPVI